MLDNAIPSTLGFLGTGLVLVMAWAVMSTLSFSGTVLVLFMAWAVNGGDLCS